MWVSDDGSFGSGVVEVFDVSGWTDADFEELENASDSERLATARLISGKGEMNE